jgi:hypothetical protein
MNEVSNMKHYRLKDDVEVERQEVARKLDPKRNGPESGFRPLGLRLLSYVYDHNQCTFHLHWQAEQCTKCMLIHVHNSSLSNAMIQVIFLQLLPRYASPKIHQQKVSN